MKRIISRPYAGHWRAVCTCSWKVDGTKSEVVEAKIDHARTDCPANRITMHEDGRPVWIGAQAQGPHPKDTMTSAASDLLDLAKDIAGLDHRYLAHGNNVLANALREWKAAARVAIAKAEGRS